MAQLSKQNLTTKINDLFGDNLTGAISAADLREVITDVVDSYFDNSNTNFTHNSLKDFGAIGDGVNYDDSAITAALNSGFAVIDGQNLSYKISGEIELPSNTKFINAKIIIDSSTYTDQNVFKAEGSLSSADTPTADVQKGTNVISVSNGTLYAKGDYIFLKSAAFWNTSESVKYGEILRIKSVTSNTLTLETNTLLEYTAAQSFKLYKINTVKNIQLSNIYCEGNLDSNSSFASFQYCTDVHVDKCKTYEFDYAHYFFKSCVDFSVEKCLIDGSGTIDGLNYGISIAFGCVNGRVSQNKMSRNRHGATIGGNDGVARHITINNCVFKDMYSSAVDSHGAVYEHSFIENEIHVTEWNGINIRGVKPTVKGNKIIGVSSHGIAWYPLVDASTGVKVSAKINNNEITYETLTTGDAYGIYCLTSTSETTSINTIDISNNEVNGETNNRGHIWVLASGGDIYSVTINNNQFSGGSREKGIYVYAVSPRTINTLMLNGNTITAGTTEPIYLRGNATGLIKRVLISSNIITGGSWSLRTDYVDYMKTVGNFYFDASSGTKLNTNTTNFTDLDT